MWFSFRRARERAHAVDWLAGPRIEAGGVAAHQDETSTQVGASAAVHLTRDGTTWAIIEPVRKPGRRRTAEAGSQVARRQAVAPPPTGSLGIAQ